MTVDELIEHLQHIKNDYNGQYEVSVWIDNKNAFKTFKNKTTCLSFNSTGYCQLFIQDCPVIIGGEYMDAAKAIGDKPTFDHKVRVRRSGK